MSIHWIDHTKPSDNGAPQVVAVGFAAMVFFMLLLPVARVSFEGSMDSRLLVEILKTGAGLNVFALLLILAPVAGIAVAMLARSAWRIASALVAVVAFIMVPLALVTLSRGMYGTSAGLASVSPGVGSYVLLLGYCILAMVTSTAALRARH
jgi:hypothetical protein